MHYRQLNSLHSDPLLDLKSVDTGSFERQMNDTNLDLTTIYMIILKMMYQRQYPLEYSCSYQESHIKQIYKKNGIYEKLKSLH